MILTHETPTYKEGALPQHQNGLKTWARYARKFETMIDFHEDYYCENCGHRESSSVGNPLYSFGRGRSQVVVCKDCLKKLEEEEREREKEEE